MRMALVGGEEEKGKEDGSGSSTSSTSSTTPSSSTSSVLSGTERMLAALCALEGVSGDSAERAERVLNQMNAETEAMQQELLALTGSGYQLAGSLELACRQLSLTHPSNLHVCMVIYMKYDFSGLYQQ